MKQHQYAPKYDETAPFVEEQWNRRDRVWGHSRDGVRGGGCLYSCILLKTKRCCNMSDIKSVLKVSGMDCFHIMTNDFFFNKEKQGKGIHKPFAR